MQKLSVIAKEIYATQTGAAGLLRLSLKLTKAAHVKERAN